nr:MAG TPA_asm: hypothetical protein [Caudoviricetes sp.]
MRREMRERFCLSLRVEASNPVIHARMLCSINNEQPEEHHRNTNERARCYRPRIRARTYSRHHRCDCQQQVNSRSASNDHIV